MKKRETAIDSLTGIFNSVKSIFAQCLSFTKILVIFGSTIVSPKEMFYIELPHITESTKALSYSTSKTLLFKNIVMCDILNQAIPSNYSNKMTVLVYGDRQSHFTKMGFIPKAQFVMSNRGTIFRFILKNSFGEIMTPIHSRQDIFNISGIQPLDLEDDHCPAIQVDEQPSSIAETEEFIWYQIPHILKGFK